MSAMLAADYKDRTVEVLGRLYETLQARRDQARIVAAECNKVHDWNGFEKAFGMAEAYSTALLDVYSVELEEKRR